jgi:predicted dehydrogenase
VTINVALVGCGHVAELHIDSLAEIDEYRLVGVYDVDVQRAADKSIALGVQHFATFESVLESGIVDAIFILTPVESHVTLAIQALEAGKHVFVEKPVATSADEARQLADVATKTGLIAMPGHNYAYVPEFRRMVNLVKSGNLGKIRAIFVHYVIRHSEEIAKTATGILREVMVHHSYLTTALVGAPNRVFAGTMEPAWIEHPEEDQAWMTWEYRGGLSAHLFATFATDDFSTAPWTFIVRVLGTEGTAELNWRSGIYNRAVPKGTLNFAIAAYEESYTEELRAFAAAIDTGQAPLSTLEDAVLGIQLIDAAYIAADSHQAVNRVEGGIQRW